MIKIKSKKILAYCRMKTVDSRGISHFAYYLLLTAFCLLAFTTEINPTIRYVSKTGSSTPPYTSWETASDSIQKCIDISEFGDTIYVANGVYEEQVIMMPGLRLIGAGMDSCYIDTRLISFPGFTAVSIPDNCVFQGFQILVSNERSGRGIDIIAINGRIIHNIIKNSGLSISMVNSSAEINSNYLLNTRNGIFIGGFTISSAPIIRNNFMEIFEGGISFDFGPTIKPKISNNVLKLKDRLSYGISLGTIDTSNTNNNLVILDTDFSSQSGISAVNRPAFIFNNLVYNNFTRGISTNGNIPLLLNNLILNSEYGIKNLGTGFVSAYYNNAWNNQVNYHNFIPDTTNLSLDPMVMNEDSLDFRLQMYSPLIDAGDPDILDVDGSRSDIGLYGGPYGMSYQYIDLPPRPPRNVIAVLDSMEITIKWNPNTEADFNHYKLFRDTTANFIADSTTFVMSLTDTLYNHIIPPGINNYYYKLTAVDNQRNESLPSEEVAVNISSMTMNDYPMTINDYILYQNYPNPFNPSTRIAYRLKEGGYVKLYVYDIKGELVDILVNQHQDGGYYEVEFNASGIWNQESPTNGASGIARIASGIYIYQIMVRSDNNIPAFTDSKKMLYLK